MIFVREVPAWCGVDGLPLSWRHFVFGMGVIQREKARTTLTHHWAVGMTQAERSARESWLSRMRQAAGW